MSDGKQVSVEFTQQEGAWRWWIVYPDDDIHSFSQHKSLSFTSCFGDFMLNCQKLRDAVELTAKLTTAVPERRNTGDEQ